MSKIPDGYVLDHTYNRRLIASDEYKHWTVATLREFLEDRPDDEPVWVESYDPNNDYIVIAPLEHLSGGDGHTFLG